MPRQARGGEQLCRAQHASVPSAPMSPLGALPPRARPRAELRGHGQGMWAPGALPSGRPSAPAPGWSASSRGTGLWPRALSTMRCPEGWSTLGGRAVWTGVPPLPTLTPQPQTPTAAWHFTRTPAAAWGTPSRPAPEARGSVFPLPSGVAEGQVPDGASFLSPRISEPVGRRGSPRTSWPPALSTSRPHPLG